MSKYTDPAVDFKLAHVADFTRVTNRNLSILSKFLNGLNFQDHFHECFLAIHLATDWTRYTNYKALSIKIMAKKLAMYKSQSYSTVYNRLKKKWKAFLDLLDSSGLTLIEYQRDPRPKTPIEYKYDSRVLDRLFNLPLDLPTEKVDQAIAREIEKEMELAKDKKPLIKPKTRSSESLADSIAKLLIKLRESTSSSDEYWVELLLAQERQGVPADMQITYRSK